MFFAYADEFGHIGPFLGRAAERYNESPVFGLAGFLMPAEEVRGFATWFYQLKCALLRWEIEQTGEPAYHWEKKGSQLYTTQNVLKYRELRQATNRMLNAITARGGTCFHVGLEKYAAVNDHQPKSLYLAALDETIQRLDEYCEGRNEPWLMLMDEQERSEFRKQIVARASASMFGAKRRRRLVEPPIQAESHLYQTLQCADWICGLVGRLAAYRCDGEEYADWEWAETYFGARLAAASAISSIRKRPRLEGS